MLVNESSSAAYYATDVHGSVWGLSAQLSRDEIAGLARGLAEEALSLAVPGRRPVVSIDVFDTLLLRNSKFELRRFWEIAHLQANHWPTATPAAASLAETLYIARIDGARLAYAVAPRLGRSSEPTLDDIYAAYRRLPGLADSDYQFLRGWELSYEEQNLRANPVIVAVVEMVREAGAQVVCISDVYLKAVDISRLISTCGIGHRFDVVYSSADTGLTKASGLAFRNVAARLSIAADEFVHLGDNAVVDGSGAVSIGARSIIVPVSRIETQRRDDDEDAFRVFLEEERPFLPVVW